MTNILVFIIRILKFSQISNPAEVMNTSDLSSTVLISDKMESRGQSDSHVVNVGEKRGISASNCDVPVPCKISKYMDNNGNNNSGVNPSEGKSFQQWIRE